MYYVAYGFISILYFEFLYSLSQGKNREEVCGKIRYIKR